MKGLQNEDISICAVALRELWSKIETMSVIRAGHSSTHAHTHTRTHNYYGGVKLRFK